MVANRCRDVLGSGNVVFRAPFEDAAGVKSDISFDEFWSQSTDDEGNPVYTGSWTGPEPEVKLLPSDSASFMNFKVTYDTESQVAVCSVEEGGGIG